MNQIKDTRTPEMVARHHLARRIEQGHLTQAELWCIAELVRTVGVLAERDKDRSELDRAANWNAAVVEYRRLVPEGGA